MRLTTKGQYAVRAVVNLAGHDEGKPITLKGISKEEGISLSYLEQLFVKLRKGEIVRSVRGPGGGYILSRDAVNISVGDVINVVEEPLNPVACLDGEKSSCDHFDKCSTVKVWAGLGERIKEFLDSVSIAQLSEEAKAFAGEDAFACDGGKRATLIK